MRACLILTLLWFIPACTEFPELDAKVEPPARSAPYPDLIPVEEIKAQVQDPLIEDTQGEDVKARAARLRARAARLRQTAIN